MRFVFSCKKCRTSLSLSGRYLTNHQKHWSGLLCALCLKFYSAIIGFSFNLQVSTEQLITNVGIQQHNMMALMNQNQEDGLCYEQTLDGQSWEQSEMCHTSQTPQPLDGQMWMQQPIAMQVWQLQSQNENSHEAAPRDIEHWIEENEDNDDTVKSEDVMLEVEVESQGSQCSGPLDLSSTEVTIVTMDKNLPVTLAAVVQEDEDC